MKILRFWPSVSLVIEKVPSLDTVECSISDDKDIGDIVIVGDRPMRIAVIRYKTAQRFGVLKGLTWGQRFSLYLRTWFRREVRVLKHRWANSRRQP